MSRILLFACSFFVYLFLVHVVWLRLHCFPKHQAKLSWLRVLQLQHRTANQIFNLACCNLSAVQASSAMVWLRSSGLESDSLFGTFQIAQICPFVISLTHCPSLMATMPTSHEAWQSARQSMIDDIVKEVQEGEGASKKQTLCATGFLDNCQLAGNIFQAPVTFNVTHVAVNYGGPGSGSRGDGDGGDGTPLPPSKHSSKKRKWTSVETYPEPQPAVEQAIQLGAAISAVVRCIMDQNNKDVC